MKLATKIVTIVALAWIPLGLHLSDHISTPVYVAVFAALVLTAGVVEAETRK